MEQSEFERRLRKAREYLKRGIVRGSLLNLPQAED
jgi:hypothetical protein